MTTPNTSAEMLSLMRQMQTIRSRIASAIKAGKSQSGIDVYKEGLNALQARAGELKAPEVHPGRTAISRTRLSRGARAALTSALERGDTVLDYGSGLGDDVRLLGKEGFDVRGFDPHHGPKGAPGSADVVLLSNVINTIPERAERIGVLRRAFGLANKALVVSAYCEPAPQSKSACYDGWCSTTDTFQAHGDHGWLMDHIKEALGQDITAQKLGSCLIKIDATKPRNPAHERVLIISCGSAKRQGTHRAQDLYTGWVFVEAAHHARRTGHPWYIISAKHGLLRPGDEIECYNAYLGDLSAAQRRKWARPVVEQLLALHPEATVEIHAGEHYAKAIKQVSDGRMSICWATQSMNFGQRRAFYVEDRRLHDAIAAKRAKGASAQQIKALEDKLRRHRHAACA